MLPRGRPSKSRSVKHQPKILQFSPRGKPGRPEEIELTIDEFEAIRLTDLLETCQKECAKSMQISQQTYSRILKKARKKIADGLTSGKIIKIIAPKKSSILASDFKL
jgi:predicted DNA-binding protein (UPF0251 family)